MRILKKIIIYISLIIVISTLILYLIPMPKQQILPNHPEEVNVIKDYFPPPSTEIDTY